MTRHREPRFETAVVLPAFNEEKTIATVILDFHQHLPDAAIIVIDNRSTDRTSEFARETFKKLGREDTHLLYEEIPGKASAIRKAFREIDARWYIMADSDHTYLGSDAPALLEIGKQRCADMVIGDRLSNGQYANQNKRKFHGIGNAIVNHLTRILFSNDILDSMSGYRVLSGRFVEHYPILCEGFELEVDMNLFALENGFKVVSNPISYQDRPAGSFSKLDTYGDGFRV